MPQKTRSQKERAAARREAGTSKSSIAPAPIETEAPNSDSAFQIQVPSAPTRRVANAATMTRSADVELDYHYVFTDLRRIALLAVLCFGIMIATAFVLR